MRRPRRSWNDRTARAAPQRPGRSDSRNRPNRAAKNRGREPPRLLLWAIPAVNAIQKSLLHVPTIESAVAAAAMAQDELGHARSSYPVLATLGVNRDDDGLGAGHPLPVIGEELPDWSSFVAANLALDGILTTFAATARSSSIEPLAPRAQNPPRGRGGSMPRRGWGGSVAPVAAIRNYCRSGSVRCGRRRHAGLGPTIMPATGRRSLNAWSAMSRQRSGNAFAAGCTSCWMPRGWAWRWTSPPIGRAGARNIADERRGNDLSVLRIR